MALLESTQLPEGWQAQDFSLPATDGTTYSLSDFKDKQGLLVIFTCNHCPYAQSAWPLVVDLHKQFVSQVAFAAINPNDAENYPDDSFKNMKSVADEFGVEFPYLHDETQKVAQAYQAQCTPDLYLFKNEDRVLKLYYHGRINDNWQNPDKATQENIKDALAALISGQEAPAQQPPSMGCSIKWK